MEFIDLKLQQAQLTSTGLTLRKNIEQRIKNVLDHGKYILGPEVTELEQKLAKFVGVDHCIAISSGTDALLASLIALGIKKDDEIITTPFSFFSTVETILLLGAVPVFVDIDPKTYNLNPYEILSAITKKTKAIIPVSLYGQPADFTEINKVAKSYQIPVIEDGAQSFGSTHNNNKSGALSTIGATSFFPSKPLGGYGDGGACFTNDKVLAKRIRQISLHGQSKRYQHEMIGINGRLDTIQAAIIIAKLELFDEEVKARQIIGNRYTTELNKLGFWETPFIASNNTSVYAQYTIQVDDRDEIIKRLIDKGIPTSVHYPYLMCEQDALLEKFNPKKGFLKKFFGKKLFKSFHITNAKKVSKRVLSLPIHPNLSEDDQNLIIKSLLAVLK